MSPDSPYRLNKSFEEFTIVAYDMPGYGESLPAPARKQRKYRQQPSEPVLDGDVLPSREYFELCANLGAKLMAHLRFKTYSVCGWDDGAKVACLLAIRHQSRCNSLLLWGFVPTMDDFSCNAVARTRDTSTWEPTALRFYSDVYGEAKFSDLWRKYVDFIVSTLEVENYLDIREELKLIKCPTLILHGSRDAIVNFKKHVKPLELKIYDSEIVRMRGLAHNIHQAAPDTFNQLLTTLVTSIKA